jgi:hypothetical protein
MGSAGLPSAVFDGKIFIQNEVRPYFYIGVAMANVLNIPVGRTNIEEDNLYIQSQRWKHCYR